MEEVYRGTYAEIDLNAIQHNVKKMKELLPKNSNIMAIVKADGYGHGATRTAKSAIKAGATAIAVAILEEAIELRSSGLKEPILVFGYVDPLDVPIAIERDIILTCFQKEWINEVMKLNLIHPVKVHMVWDTGMGRLGVRSVEELEETVLLLSEAENIELDGVYTHFATADENDLTYYEAQSSKFEIFLEAFEQLFQKPVVIHTSNSAASIRFLKQRRHYIRLGVSLYGMYPSRVVKEENIIHLKQAFSLHSRLVHVKQIYPGESLSYGATYTAKDNEWIGTIPIGYADGWIRKLQGFNILIDGKFAPIVGRICMDQMMVKLDKSYPTGTKVTLIGKQNNAEISMDDVADHLETINYEIPCNITKRIPRVYVE